MFGQAIAALADLFAPLGNLRAGTFLLVLLIHFGIYCLRALRFSILIPVAVRPRFHCSLLASAAHSMAMYLLPAKSGDPSLLFYLRTHGGVPVPNILASLLISRFLDGATLCISLSAAWIWLGAASSHDLPQWFDAIGVPLFVLTVVFSVLAFRGNVLVSLVEFLFRILRLEKRKAGVAVLNVARRVRTSLEDASDLPTLLYAAVVSGLMWLGVFAFYAALSSALGPLSLPFAEVVLGSSIATLHNLLPLNVFAGIGTQELGWVIGFNQVLGFDYRHALSAGIGVHAVQLFNVVLMGLLAHLLMALMAGAGRRRVGGNAEAEYQTPRDTDDHGRDRRGSAAGIPCAGRRSGRNPTWGLE